MVLREYQGRAFLIGLILCLATVSLRAELARELSWEDLLPPSLLALEKKTLKFGKQLRGLSQDERALYDEVGVELLVHDKLAKGLTTQEELSLSELELLAKNSSQKHPEIVQFWREFQEIRTAIESQDNQVDPALNGEQIRLPGYVLPLEFTGTKVREFLLVPYVGACIHTPPPPANQMVYVKAANEFNSEGLFTPVWVEGRIFTTRATRDLFLVDGERSIDIGYTFEAIKVEPYRE